jgi:acylphosphatase
MQSEDKTEILEMHAVFGGRVHGVGFRATTCHIAQELDIKGSVENLTDGSVEVFAQGTLFQLDSLISRIEIIFGEQIEYIERSFYPPQKIHSGFKTKF